MPHCKNQTGEGICRRQALVVASRLASGAIRSRTLSITIKCESSLTCVLFSHDGLEHIRVER